MTQRAVTPLRIIAAGDTVEYTVTYLEMTERPSYARPHLFGNTPSALIHAVEPPNWYFLMLYDAVGRDYEWVDRHSQPQEALSAFVRSEQVQLYTFLRNGWPHGFFVLDHREEGRCDIAYLGLVRQAVGLGLGRWLLETAVHMAWDIPGTGRVTLNTCTLDHPRALALYQKHARARTRSILALEFIRMPREKRR